MKENLGYKQKQTKISVSILCVRLKIKEPNKSYILLARNRVVFKAPTSETYPLSPSSMDVKVARVWQVGNPSPTSRGSRPTKSLMPLGCSLSADNFKPFKNVKTMEKVVPGEQSSHQGILLEFTDLQSNHGCSIRSLSHKESWLKSPSNVCLLLSNPSTIVVLCCIVVFHRILTGLIHSILHQLGLLKPFKTTVLNLRIFRYSLHQWVRWILSINGTIFKANCSELDSFRLPWPTGKWKANLSRPVRPVNGCTSMVAVAYCHMVKYCIPFHLQSLLLG